MRVVHIASGDLWAGAEVQVFTLLDFLRRDPALDVHAVVLNDRELARRLREADVPVTVIDETRLGAVAILGRLVRTLRRLRPDVVHTHRYKENILGGLAAAAAGVPAAVCTVHGLTERYTGFARLKMDLYTALDHAVIRGRRQTVVAVSADMARRLAPRIGPSICLIPNGIRLPEAVPADRPRWPAGTPGGVVLGTAARLVPVKGLDILLEAVRLLSDAVPDVRLLVVGDGPLRAPLEARAAALGLAGRTWFVGHRPDVPRWLAAMDVFVLPSLAEGLPMSLLEAMAGGRPVVASRVGGVPEVVRDGIEGRLVPPGDPRALADACLALATDADARAALGAAARRRVAEAFTIDATGPRYVALYRRLASTRAAA
ncbi:MAG TPA: glycosyltransferase [Thermodesulfobacteriota bacterium]